VENRAAKKIADAESDDTHPRKNRIAGTPRLKRFWDLN
jgi:hypothetical protein